MGLNDIIMKHQTAGRIRTGRPAGGVPVCCLIRGWIRACVQAPTYMGWEGLCHAWSFNILPALSRPDGAVALGVGTPELY